MGRSSISVVSRALDDLVFRLLTWENVVSEGGLGRRSWCCLTDSVIHHRSKLTRQGPPGSAFRRRAAAPPRPRDQSEDLTCGNDGRVSRNRAAGQDRTAASAPRRSISWQAGNSLLLLPGSSRTAAAALRTSPDDLAAELNPHKTELNPHKAVEAASRARTDQTGLPSSGQGPPARQLAKAELSRRPRSAVPMTLRYRRGPSLRTHSRRRGFIKPSGSRRVHENSCSAHVAWCLPRDG
jgi:hypothetical protein